MALWCVLPYTVTLQVVERYYFGRCTARYVRHISKVSDCVQSLETLLGILVLTGNHAIQ